MTRASLEQAEHAARKMAAALKAMTPDGWAFMVFLASKGAGGAMTYLSTIERNDAIRALSEWIARQRTDPRVDPTTFHDETEKACWCCSARTKLITIVGPHRSVDLCADCILRDQNHGHE